MTKWFLLFLLFFPLSWVMGQENDDLYFTSSDRELLQKKEPKKKKAKQQKTDPILDPSVELLTWKLQCKGLNSRFGKTFSGHSGSFSEAPKSLEDSLKFFFKSEKISISFSFDSTSVLLTDTIEWNDLKEFFSTRVSYISNCEKMNFSYPEWLTPLIVDKGTLFTIDKALSAPEGEGSLKISGKRVGNICSFSKYFKNEYSNSYVSIKSPQSDVDKTWIFFYAYGSGDSTDALQLMVYQTVYQKGVTITILQKAYTYKIPLNFTGWKPIAIRYSELELPEGMEETAERKPKDISSIEFSLISQSPDGEASIYLDHIMILSDQ